MMHARGVWRGGRRGTGKGGGSSCKVAYQRHAVRHLDGWFSVVVTVVGSHVWRWHG